MAEKELIQLFGEQKVRTKWDDEKEKWYFSIVDVCWVLTDQPDYDGAKNYWKVLKFRLKAEGNESVTNCNQLKMVSPKDGKGYKTAVARKGGKIAGDARENGRLSYCRAEHVVLGTVCNDILSKRKWD